MLMPGAALRRVVRRHPAVRVRRPQVLSPEAQIIVWE